MSFFLWFISNWLILIYLIVVFLAWWKSGWQFALIIASFGAAGLAFKSGQKSERDNAQQRAEKIESERENAYVEIDDRDTDRDDVIERLRNNGF